MKKSFVRLASESIALVILLLCTAAEAQERHLAIVVGVNAYRANSGLPKLQHAASDAAVLSATLRDAGFKVYEMTHDVARRDGQETMAPQLAYIRDQTRGILETPNLGEEDAVMITLHGHGVQFDFVDEKGNKTPRFYFCPADATIDGVKTANDITDRHNLLPLEELYTDLAECKAATKLLIVDACRNDPNQPGVFREALASSTLPKLPPPTGGTAAFFSCKANQRAVEDTTLKNGVFTHFLVKGLQGEADLPTAGKPADGIITFAELSAYVANNTYAHVFDKFKVRQSPELRGDYDLNLPLAKIEKRLPTAAGIKFALIPAGSFMMGSDHPEAGGDEKPVHRVQISKPFYAGIHEVAIGQTLSWLNAPGVVFKDEWIDPGAESCPVFRAGNTFEHSSLNRFCSSDDQPMQDISWFGAVAFCEWCCQQDPKFRYRLPTEVEWEYMARAGSTTEFPWGDSLNGTDANVDGRFPFGTETEGDYKFVTTTVATYGANKWGLFDTAGNVYEWCRDWYAEDSYANSSARDPSGPGFGSSRVLRGGSFYYNASDARSAGRYDRTPDYRSFDIGFRVVCE